jgi:hypothetical protein
MGASMKMDVYGVVAPCSLVEVYRRFIGACSVTHRPDYEDSKHVCNVGYILARLRGAAT